MENQPKTCSYRQNTSNLHHNNLQQKFTIAEWKTFKGGNFYKLVEDTIFAEKTFADCLLVQPTKHHAPKVRRENFHEEPQNLEIHKSFLPQKFSLSVQYLLFEHAHAFMSRLHTIISTEKPQNLGNSQKFSPSKISCWTIFAFCTST